MLRRAHLTRRLYRSYSTASNPYSNFKKLRAFPFAFDEETARSYMGVFGAGLCQHKLINSALARVIPFFRPQGFQPTRIAPLYFPAWIADAELEADIRYNGVEKTAKVQLENAYVPGSDFQVLSTTPLVNASELLSEKLEPVRWTTDLMRQFDQDISCLPFVIDPRTGFSIFANEEEELFPSLHVPFNTIRQKFAVFRPVLIPMYVAQYDADGIDPGEHRSCTVFIDASTSFGTIHALRSPDNFVNEYDAGVNDMAQRLGFYHPNNTSDFFTFGVKSHFVDSGTVSVSPPRDVTKAVLKWLDWKMRDPETIRKLTDASEFPADNDFDDDPRIREYVVEEREAVTSWMEVGAEQMMTRRILERIKEQMGEIGDDAPQHMRMPIEHLEKNEQELEKARQELLPQFWKEYVEQQILEDRLRESKD